MLIRQIVDDSLAQNAYLIGCQRTGEALIIDPERDVDRYLELAAREGLRLVAAAETHIHADFLSGARELAAKVPGLRVFLSAEGGEGWTYGWPADDGVAATFLHDGDTFSIGHIDIRAWHTPGHTPEHLTFTVTDRGGGATAPMALVTGDFVFVNDVGRPDLLESALGATGVMHDAARRLHTSLDGLAAYDDHLQIWPGHGAGSACGKALGAVPTTTVGYERRNSPALQKARDGAEPFTAFILADQPEPPLYFAEMKRLNKVGPPILGSLPQPPQLSAEQLWTLATAGDATVVDTRGERAAFFAGHVPGSLYAPMDRSFSSIVGSMVAAGAPVALIIDDDRVEDAVRRLVRIGYDRIVGWAPSSVVGTLQAGGRELATVPSIDMAAFEVARHQDSARVLDVRSGAEHRDRHVPGALNIAHTRLRGRLDELPPDSRYFVHCASGARAAASAALLASRGYDVVHVDGAFAGWESSAGTAKAGR